MKKKYIAIILLFTTSGSAIDEGQQRQNEPFESTDRTRQFSTWASGDDYQNVSQLITQRYLSNSTAASGTMLNITTSGRYYLAGNLAVDPQNNNVTVIKISASNVVLDMRGYALSSTRVNGGAGTIAIEVATNLYNVKIVNGVLSGMDGTGIKVNSGCTSMVIENMFVDNCTLVGITVGANCHGFKMSDSKVTRCDGSHADATDGAVGFKITSTTLVHLENCYFNLNQHAGTGNAIGAYINSCTHAHFLNCTAYANKAGSATGNTTYGFRFDGSSNHVHLHDCQASHNLSQDGKVYGFYIDGATDGGELYGCEADANVATGDECHGFSLSSSSNTLSLVKCRVHNNSGNNDVYGFKLNASQYIILENCYASGQSTTGSTKNVYGFYSTGGTGNTFVACEAFGNTASATGAAIGAGFYLTGSEKYASILRCSSKSNAGGAGTGYGIYLQSATVCMLRENELFVNTGTSGGYGIKDDATSSISAFANNFAFGNGNVAGTTVNNYDVKLSPNDSADIFPVKEAFLTDYTNLKNVLRFDNIELIEKADVTSLRA